MTPSKMIMPSITVVTIVRPELQLSCLRIVLIFDFRDLAVASINYFSSSVSSSCGRSMLVPEGRASYRDKGRVIG